MVRIHWWEADPCGGLSHTSAIRFLGGIFTVLRSTPDNYTSHGIVWYRIEEGTMENMGTRDDSVRYSIG